MKIRGILKPIFKYTIILTLIALGVMKSLSMASSNAEEIDGYFEDFDDTDIGVTQVKNRWALMIYDGQETGVSVMPGEESGKCLKISNVPDGTTPGGDWMNNSKALTNFEKEVNVISVDFYIPEGTGNFADDDCAFVQLRQSSANFVAFAIYGNGIKEYKTNGDEPEVYKDSIKRGEWVNVSVHYYPMQKTFSLYYKESGKDAELILENKAITPSKWTNTQMTDFRIMSSFKASRELHYFMIDNIDVYATNRKPYLKNVIVDGAKNEKIGETLKTGFTYHSDLMIDEKETLIQWYRSVDLKPGDVQGNIEYSPIEGATSRTYTTTEDDLYHYVYYTAKPIDMENNEGVEYRSGAQLIYLDNAINDFEGNNVGDSTFKAFQIKSNNTLASVEEKNGNKFLSIMKNPVNGDETYFEIESAYQFGLRDRNVCYETDLILSERIKAGSVMSMSFVFNKDSSFFGKSVIEALVFEDNALYVGLDQKFILPIGEWFKLKIYLLNKDELQYVVQVLDKNSNTIYVSDTETITNLLAIELYENIGISSVLVRYDSLSSEELVKVSMDNIVLKYTDDQILLMGGDLGLSTTRKEFEYDFITSCVGDIDASSIRFECSGGALPRGISINGGKLSGSLSREGKYDFEITAFDGSGNRASAQFHMEVADAYTITFNSNKGSEIDSITVSPNSKIAKLEIPTRTGYIFVGWKRDNGEFWDKENDVVTSDETFVAEWKAKEFLLSYIDTDGSLLKAEKVTYKSEVIMPDELSKKNWYMDPDFMDPLVDGFSMPAKNVSLYAKGTSDEKVIDLSKKNGCKNEVACSISLLLLPIAFILYRRKEDEVSLYNE